MSVVLLPPLEQIVAGDVGLVADGQEGAQADAAALRLLHRGEPQASALRQQPEPAVPRRSRCERRVERDRRIVVADAHAVRPDEPHAVRSAHVEELGLARLAIGAGLGEARREDHEGAHAAGGARTRDAEHRGGRDGDDGELDRTWHLVHRSERSPALHLVRVVVDEMQWSRVAGGEDVVHQLPGDRAAAARGTDDHDAVGLEQVTHARDGG